MSVQRYNHKETSDLAPNNQTLLVWRTSYASILPFYMNRFTVNVVGITFIILYNFFLSAILIIGGVIPVHIIIKGVVGNFLEENRRLAGQLVSGNENTLDSEADS